MRTPRGQADSPDVNDKFPHWEQWARARLSRAILYGVEENTNAAKAFVGYRTINQRLVIFEEILRRMTEHRLIQASTPLWETFDADD